MDQPRIVNQPDAGGARESAAERQARLRALVALQRDALDAQWQQLVPVTERVDTGLARLRRLREHPLALGLLAVAASAALVSRRGRRLFGPLRSGWRLGVRAATLISLWQSARGGRPAGAVRRRT
jgi:hypothetical protein